MSLVEHAQKELELAGLFDEDSDYKGDTGRAVIELMEVFSKQGHSGFSAGLVLDVFERLAKYQTLTPITSDPNEWSDVSEYMGNITSWQNCRNPSNFSDDGGQTWYDLDDPEKKNWPIRYIHQE